MIRGSISPRPASAGSASGTSGAAFLKLAPGARPAGMGEAFAAVEGDAHAVFYNPAGLGRLRELQATGTHDARFQGIRYEFAAVAVPLLSFTETEGDKSSRGALAVAVYNLAASGIERRGTTETDAPTGTFGASDLAYSVAYGYALSPAVSVGGAIKFVEQSLDDARATAVAGDAGIALKRGASSFAGGIRNAGSAPKFRDAGDPLPFTAYLAAARPFGERWLAAADLLLPRDQAAGLALGTEYAYPFDARLKGFLRAGFNTLHRDPGGISGLSLGGGLALGSMRFDFAWLPMGDLGNTFRYSVLARF